MIRLLGEAEKKLKFVIFENASNINSNMFVKTLQLFKYDLELILFIQPLNIFFNKLRQIVVVFFKI